MNISLLKLQIIEALYKHKKVTAVAEQLNLKQPTVTFHLRSLEKELGVQLFESKSGKISLTEAGDSLYHYAVRINSLAHEAERVVKEYDGLGRGHLIIGASYVAATYLLPNILCRFEKDYPGITVSMTVRTAPAVVEMLKNHEIDLGVILSEAFQSFPVVNENLCEDEIVFVFSPGHRLAQFQVLQPENLSGVPFVLHGQHSSTRNMTLKWFESNGITLNAKMEMDSLEAIKQVVVSGDYVSVISRLAIGKEIDRGELLYRAVSPNALKRHVCCAYNQDRKQSALLDRFIQYLKDAIKWTR